MNIDELLHKNPAIMSVYKKTKKKIKTVVPAASDSGNLIISVNSKQTKSITKICRI